MTFAYDSEIHDKLIQHLPNFSDFQFSIFNYELCIINYELTLGVPAIAVGLSAISFSAALQKDAASIPNAFWGGDGERERELTTDC